MERPSLYIDCKNCGMKFESLEQFKVHTEKFCKGSDYENYNKLQKILNSTKKEKDEAPLNYNKSINNTSKFLASVQNSSNDLPVNLDKIAEDIKGRQQDFYKAATKIASREDLLKEELERISKANKKDETELLFIMSDLQDKREAEIRGLKEKDLVSRALKDLDKRNLNALEYQKKTQLKKLAEERENLKNQENDLFAEIQRMQARLLDDEKMIKLEKEKIEKNIVTIKDVNFELAEKRLEELSNIRGKEVASIKEKKESLEIEKHRLENELKSLQTGEIRKNNSGILAGSSILTPLVPLNLEDRRNLPKELVLQNQKWNEDFERLAQMKKKYEEYVQNEPGYDVKPSTGEKKPRFGEEMNNMVKFYDTNLKPGQKARVLEYIKEDLDQKDPLPTAKPKVAEKTDPESDPLKYNKAKFKLSTEPYQSIYKKDNKEDIFSPSGYQKYKQEEDKKYSDKKMIGYPRNYQPEPQNEFGNNPERSPNMLQSQKLDQNPWLPNQWNPFNQPNPYNPSSQNSLMNQNNLNSNPMNSSTMNNPLNPMNPYFSYNPYDPYNPYTPYNPYFPYPMNPDSYKPVPNPETEKLKEELNALKNQIKSKTHKEDPKAFEAALNLPYFPQTDSKLYPEEKLISSMIGQEKEELKLLAGLPKDSELYIAKMTHYKEMARIRTKMEATLQELTLQRMKRSVAYEQVLDDKRFAEEIWKEDQRKLQVLEKLAPKPVDKDYSPIKGFYIGWDTLTGIPQKFKKTQIAYGIFERGEVRLEPRLVLPAKNEEDPMNPLANKCSFKEVQDIKQLPPVSQILTVIEIQSIDSFNKISVSGWTALALFTNDRKVQEGYWKLPIYRPPTVSNIYLPDIKIQAIIPNSFLYVRLYAADNSLVFPFNANQRVYKIPVYHARETMIETKSEGPDIIISESKPGSRVPSLPNSRKNIRTANGLWVRLETLTGFKSRADLKFRITIYKGEDLVVDDRGGFCKWTSEPINSQNADVSLNPIVEGSRNGSFLPEKEVTINKQTQFLKNFVLLEENNNWADDIIMVVEILEKNSRKLSIVEGGLSSAVDDYYVIAWTLYELTDFAKKDLNYGTIQLNLYKPPVPQPLSAISVAEQVSGTIKLTIQDLSKNMSEKLMNSRPLSVKQPFLENLSPQYDDGKLFKKGDGVDFYIDGGRFFPDNVSCTRVIVKSFTNKLETVGPAVAGLPVLSSLAYSPEYGFRTEFRTPIFDPTTTLVVTIITFDTSNKEVRVVGYSAINLFIHKYRKNQPTAENEEDFILNSGAFQLPIYCQEPFRKLPFGLQSFTRLEMIPCASLLVRIKEAPKAQQGVRILSIKDVPPSEWYIRGVVVPPPKYEDRAYNTSFCMPSPIERALYLERMKRQSVTVLEATTMIMQELGFRLELSEDEMLNWINEKLVIDTRTPIIDMKYFAKYSTSLGFKVSIDAVHHVPKGKPHIVLFSLNPPASFYTQSVISQDIQISDKFDWASSAETPVFLDGFSSFKNIQFNPCLSVIIDLRSVDTNSREVKAVAWTVLPVFYEDGYVKSGIYQIPFFAGPVPASLLPDFASEDPWEFVIRSTGKSGGPVFFEPVSVLLRIVDCQREGHFETPMDLNRLNYDYVPDSKRAAYSYNAAAFQRNEDGNSLKKTIPNDISPANYNKMIHETVVNALDLPHLL